MKLRWGAILLPVVLAGCAGVKTVRVNRGHGASPVVVAPRGQAAVGLEPQQFRKVEVELARNVRPFIRPLTDARRLFGAPRRSVSLLYDGRSQRLLSTGDEARHGLHLVDPVSEDLTRGYWRWCERRREPGDCLALLHDGPLLESDGKYALAMAIAIDGVWSEISRDLRGIADPKAIRNTLIVAMTVYLLLWALPEPVSKGIAAILTAAAIAYLGVLPVWNIIDGWIELVKTVDRATTFDEVRAVGEQYRGVLGESAARVMVMLITAAVGQGAGGLAQKLPNLPGAPQASLVMEAQTGVAISSVESVAMTAEGFTLQIAAGSTWKPQNAVASKAAAVADAAKPTPGVSTAAQGALLQAEAATGAPEPPECQGQIHHIISRPIAEALQKHPTLRGLYKPRDPRYVTKAKDLTAHCGYQNWHREVDAEVIGWLDTYKTATPAEFMEKLHEIYSRPDMQARFPNGF